MLFSVCFLLPLKVVPPYTASSTTSSLTSLPSSLTINILRPATWRLPAPQIHDSWLCVHYKFSSSYYYYNDSQWDEKERRGEVLCWWFFSPVLMDDIVCRGWGTCWWHLLRYTMASHCRRCSPARELYSWSNMIMYQSTQHLTSAGSFRYLLTSYVEPSWMDIVFSLFACLSVCLQKLEKLSIKDWFNLVRVINWMRHSKPWKWLNSSNIRAVVFFWIRKLHISCELPVRFWCSFM